MSLSINSSDLYFKNILFPKFFVLHRDSFNSQGSFSAQSLDEIKLVINKKLIFFSLCYFSNYSTVHGYFLCLFIIMEHFGLPYRLYPLQILPRLEAYIFAIPIY